ncbi:Cache 3/Cache 2 fusion domain-containing protein [Pantoea tagorei]
MKRLSLSRMSLGVKLSVLTSLSVALLLFVLTLTQSHTAARQLESLATDDMHNQVQGISEMAAMFNATLTEEVNNYTQLFASFLPQRFSRDESSRIQVGEFSTPTLRAGLKTLNLDQIAVDDFFSAHHRCLDHLCARRGRLLPHLNLAEKRGRQPRHRDSP